MARRVVRAVLEDAGVAGIEVSLVITTDEEIRELNRRFRSRDASTDVLSFPMGDEILLGDVVVSYDRAVEQAAEFGVATGEELARLFIHGSLHLLGFDHTRGGRQAARMKGKEEELALGLRQSGLI